MCWKRLRQKNTKIIDSDSESKFDEFGFFENHIRRQKKNEDFNYNVSTVANKTNLLKMKKI